MRLKINDSLIVWPGNMRKKPEGIMIPTHLKVLTIEEKPFVYVRRLTNDEISCDEDEIACPHFNSTDGVGTFRSNFSVLIVQLLFFFLCFIIFTYHMCMQM